MRYFESSDEVYHYIGGVLRAALDHPVAGPSMTAAGVTVRLDLGEPDATFTIRFRDPSGIEVGAAEEEAEVRITMSADVCDRYWRGEYNLAIGVGRGKVQIDGPLSTLMELASSGAPMFPIYRAMVADKDRLRGAV